MADEEKKDVVKYQEQIPLKNGLPAPTTLEQMFRVAKLLAASQMVPEAYQVTLPKPYERWADVPQEEVKRAFDLATQKIVAATIMGNELGMTMFSALRSIAVINGRPSVWGEAVGGLVESKYPLEDVQEYFEGSIEQKTRTAICIVKRKDRKNSIKVTFSMEDAKRAGLLDENTKHHSPWKKYTDAMLMSKARRAYKSAAPGALMGMPFAEDAMDMEPVSEVPDAVPVTPTADMGIDEPAAGAGARQDADEAGSSPPEEEGPIVDADGYTTETEVVDESKNGLTPPPELLEFITDMCPDPDELQKLMVRFDSFVDDLCTFYNASRADVYDQMVKDGLEQAWDKFMGWINEKAKERHQKAKELQKDIDDQGAGVKDNPWASGGWKRQGGEKFRSYLTNNLKSLYQMPDDFIRQMEERWASFNLGAFPSMSEIQE